MMLRIYLLLGLSFVAMESGAGERRFEFSFGTTQMIIKEAEREELRQKSKVTLPTAAALFIAEYIWSERWGSMFAFNYPLVTKKYIVAGELIEEAAANTMLIGQRYTPFTVDMTENARLSLQLGGFLGVVDGDPILFSPTLAARFHIIDVSGLSMYLGGSRTYGIQGYSIFYGIGQRF